MGMQSKYIWINGELVEFEKATIHFLTPALHYGVGVFEGIRCYATPDGPAVFRLREHTRRLVNSAKVKHIGSQITKIAPFVDAVKRILILLDELRKQKVPIRYLDIGGGLGITYFSEKPPVPADVAKRLLPLLKGRDITLVMEPGRSIVGNAGILVTKTLYLKKGGSKTFVIVDAGMNDLMRPSLYDAYHHILPVKKSKRVEIKADVVGPICESGDFLAKGRTIGSVNRGEFLAVMSAGAYGMSMSSNYNSRPNVAEVMVNGKAHALRKSASLLDGMTTAEREERLADLINEVRNEIANPNLRELTGMATGKDGSSGTKGQSQS